MRPRIADPRSGMSRDERDAPAAADGPARRGSAGYMPCRAGCARHGARGRGRDTARVGRSAPRQDPAAIGLRPAADPAAWPGVSGRMRRLCDFELEPGVRGWLDSLSDSDFKRVDEVCGMLAEKGTELADPLVVGREVSPGRGCRPAGMRGRQGCPAAFR
jgi:hypothetical protein